MTWKRAAKSIVLVTAVVSVLCVSALAMVRGQTTATLLDRSDDLKTAAVVRADWNSRLQDARRLFVAARREVVEHVEYVINEIVGKR